jgi:hypothetical protein
VCSLRSDIRQGEGTLSRHKILGVIAVVNATTKVAGAIGIVGAVWFVVLEVSVLLYPVQQDVLSDPMDPSRVALGKQPFGVLRRSALQANASTNSIYRKIRWIGLAIAIPAGLVALISLAF